MRLRLSIAVLVILACFLLEASATTSNRKTEAIKVNSRSTNSKDVRYSKNKPGDYRKKESGKEQAVSGELEKRKKQRREAHGNQKIKSTEVLKNNKYERGGKLSYEEQNQVKSYKRNKLDKSAENFKNDKSNVNSNTKKSKKSKRSLEFDQPEDLDTHGEEGASDNVDSRYTTKKMSENTLRKKSESKADDVDNIELERNSHSSEARKIDSSKKNKVKLDKRGDSVMKKTHKRSGENDSMCKENVARRDSELEKKIQIIEKSDVDDLSENGYHLNGEVLMKGKKCKAEKLEDKQRSSKKSSTTGSKKKCRKYVDSAQVLHEEENSAQKLEDHESGSCDMETQCMPKRNKVHAEESEYFADDIVKSIIVNSDEQDVEKNFFESLSNVQEVDSEDSPEADEDMNDEENCSQENWLE